MTIHDNDSPSRSAKPSPGSDPAAHDGGDLPEHDLDEVEVVDLDADVSGAPTDLEALARVVAGLDDAGDSIGDRDDAVDPSAELDDAVDPFAEIEGLGPAPPDEPPATDLGEGDLDELVELVELETRAEPLDGPTVIDLDDGAPVGSPAEPSSTGHGGSGAVEPDDGPPDISTPEQRQRLLAAALAHAEVQDAQYRLPLTLEHRPGRWKGYLALVLLALAGVVALAPPAWLVGPGPPPLDAATAEAAALAALVLQAEQIRVFNLRNGRLPETLDEVPVRLPGLQYVRSNNRVFQLVAPMPDGGTIVYEAARPSPRFQQAESTLLGSPGS